MAGKEIAVKKYVVRLDAEERDRTRRVIRKGKRSAQLLTKARILLKADVSDAGEGWSDSRIAAALDTSIATVERTRRQLVEEGFEAVLARKYNSNSARRRIFDGAAEAKLIALTLSPAPAGFARWSLRLLEEEVVELHIVERASDNTIGRTLKKNILKPHHKQQWVIPPDANAAFVATMEDVLEVYQRPHDPQRPLVCLDETSKQLIIETRAPIPAKPGQPARHDYEYERNGVANLFMVFAPLEGWRHVKAADRHTAIDYAHVSGICPTRIFPTRPKSCWCRIISTSTSQPRSMRPFPRPRPAGSSSGSNGITPPSTAVGSTWPNPNSAFSRRNVWIAASLTSKSSPTKSPHGTTTATSTTPKPTGNSQPPTPASS